MFYLLAHRALGDAHFMCGAGKTSLPGGHFEGLKVGDGRAKAAHGRDTSLGDQTSDKALSMTKRNRLVKFFRLHKLDSRGKNVASTRHVEA